MRRRNRPRGLFITGTDTGVGKTVVACAIAAWCRQRGIRVGVMKPIATGGRWVRTGGTRRLVSDDARRLVQAARVDDAWDLVNPVCFKEPLAPWTAARRSHTHIRINDVLAAFDALCSRHEFLIVEGIGGLLVPLSAHVTVADLAKQFGLPLLIVARPDLGTLNHTLLTIRWAEHAGLACHGLVINHATTPSPRDPMSRLAQRTNPEILNRLTRQRLLGELPFVPARTDTHGDSPARWSTRIAQSLGMQTLERLVSAKTRQTITQDRSQRIAGVKVDTHQTLW